MGFRGGLSQDGITSGSNSLLFVNVLDCIAMSAKTPTSLKKALAFKVVELSLRFAPRGDSGCYAVRTTDTRSKSNREADGGYPGAPVSRARCGKVGPTRTSTTAPSSMRQCLSSRPAETVEVQQRTVEHVASASKSGRNSRGGQVGPV